MRCIVTPLVTSLLAGAGAVSISSNPLLAQTQTWQRQGAPLPKDARVVPENCRTSSDGTITCNTRVKGGEGRPPAAPRLDPFPN